MRVALPADISEWQSELTVWQREALVGAARGFFNDFYDHDRMQVIRTHYGFDIVGLERVTAFHSDGSPVEDAWRLTWVCEVHPDHIGHGDFEGKYRAGRIARRHGRPESGRYRRGSERTASTYDRREARRRRRAKRRQAKQGAAMRAELDRLRQELADWIGHPTSFPGYDRIYKLQEVLSDSR